MHVGWRADDRTFNSKSVVISGYCCFPNPFYDPLFKFYETFQWIENKYSNKCLYTNAHSNAIQNIQKVEIAQTFVDEWINEMSIHWNMIYHNKEYSVGTCRNMNELDSVIHERSQVQKAAYCLKWKAYRWLPGAWSKSRNYRVTA